MSPTPESRYKNVVILHDREDNPDGHAGRLHKIIAEAHPTVRFICPHVPYTSDVKSSFNLAAIKLLPMLQPDTLVIGIGLGGLFACALQERFDQLNLSVFAVNPPSSEGEVEVAYATGPTASAVRVVLYSSAYEPIKNSCLNWPTYAEYCYDVPWLANGIDKATYATSYLISAFMRGLDLAKEVPTMFPKKEEAKKDAAGI